MADTMYHVFFESIAEDDGVSYYIGMYLDKEYAKETAEYVWELWHSSKEETGKIQELSESFQFWKQFNIFPETLTYNIPFKDLDYYVSSGLSTALVIHTNDPNFLPKFIRFRGSIQHELFPPEPNEKCEMYQYKEKRLIVQKKLLRRHKIPETKNIIIIYVSEFFMHGTDISKNFHMFKNKKIEVTQKFFDIMEHTDYILISMKDKNIKNEIVDFDNYFRNDILLRASFYDEKKNVLHMDLGDVR